MKEEFIEYLNAIGITTDVLHQRVEKIYEDCLEICNDEFVDIFVDDYIKEDGTRQYESITFFSDKYHFGARQFLTEDNYLIISTNKKVLVYVIRKQNYDFKKATEKSRLNLYIKFEGEGGIEGNFKASKENCDFLKDIFFKYFKPRC